mgnify:FL=1
MKHKTHTAPAKADRPNLFRRMFRKIRENRIAFAVYCVLCLITIAVIVVSAIQQNWSGCFNGVLTLLLFFLPAFLEDKLNIRLSAALEIITMLFVFAAEILGEVGRYYTRFPFWDNLLHCLNGFLFAAFGFALVEICNRSKKITFQLSPFFLALVACCFSLSIGVFWEFIEFFTDLLTRSDMQKDTFHTLISSGKFSADGQTPIIIRNITETVITTADGQSYTVNGYLDIGLFDTMKDLMVDFIGAFLFSVIGYFHLKFSGRSRIAKALIPEVPSVEEHGTSEQTEPQAQEGTAEQSK